MTGRRDDRVEGTDLPEGANLPGQGPGSNPEKDPADWVTGDEPMTGPQRSYLQTLAREIMKAHETARPQSS